MKSVRLLCAFLAVVDFVTASEESQNEATKTTLDAAASLSNHDSVAFWEKEMMDDSDDDDKAARKLTKPAGKPAAASPTQKPQAAASQKTASPDAKPTLPAPAPQLRKPKEAAPASMLQSADKSKIAAITQRTVKTSAEVKKVGTAVSKAALSADSEAASTMKLKSQLAQAVRVTQSLRKRLKEVGAEARGRLAFLMKELGPVSAAMKTTSLQSDAPEEAPEDSKSFRTDFLLIFAAIAGVILQKGQVFDFSHSSM